MFIISINECGQSFFWKRNTWTSNLSHQNVIMKLWIHFWWSLWSSLYTAAYELQAYTHTHTHTRTNHYALRKKVTGASIDFRPVFNQLIDDAVDYRTWLMSCLWTAFLLSLLITSITQISGASLPSHCALMQSRQWISTVSRCTLYQCIRLIDNTSDCSASIPSITWSNQRDETGLASWLIVNKRLSTPLRKYLMSADSDTPQNSAVIEWELSHSQSEVISFVLTAA